MIEFRDTFRSNHRVLLSLGGSDLDERLMERRTRGTRAIGRLMERRGFATVI